MASEKTECSPVALQVVLASTSPSRLSILRSAGVEPLVIASGVDEDAVVANLQPAEGKPAPKHVVAALAEAKARAVIDDLEGASAGAGNVLGTADSQEKTAPAILIGGDSMLLIDGELQGKPHTAEETVRRWHNQRGKTAVLLTGHAVFHRPSSAVRDAEGAENRILHKNGATPQHHNRWCPDPYVEVSTTRLHFAEATDADIEAYAATGEPFGCAGAFTLEALGGWFIDRIEGDPSSVIGLSLPVVRRAIAHFGYPASTTWNRH